ncbi:kinase-like protein, partial [Paxillus ammoniavirescens]
IVNQEIRTWLHLDHINVLPVFGFILGLGQFPAMVCPWLENGSLTSYLERRNDTLTKVERLTLVSIRCNPSIECNLHGHYSLVMLLRVYSTVGVNVHSQFVVHGDLSGSNVLIDDKGRAYISDFGLSNLLARLEGPTFETSCIPRKRTLRWAAPELLGGENPSPRSDVYSFGGIMLQILTGRVPYHYYNSEPQVIRAIFEGRTPQRPRGDPVTDHHWAFMRQCWAPVNTARPSDEEIVQFVRHELVDILGYPNDV